MVCLSGESAFALWNRWTRVVVVAVLLSAKISVSGYIERVNPSIRYREMEFTPLDHPYV